MHPTITQSGDTTTVTFNVPTAGTYFIGIKYDAKSIVGASAPTPGTTVHYNFATTGVPGSSSGLDLVLKHQLTHLSAWMRRAIASWRCSRSWLRVTPAR